MSRIVLFVLLLATTLSANPATYFDWDVAPTGASTDTDSFGCFAGVEFCEPRPIRTRTATISGGRYGADFNRDGRRDATLTAEARLVSEVRSNADGTFTYRWRLTNLGTGAVISVLGDNCPQFAVSAGAPMLGSAGADRIPGTHDDLAVFATQFREADSPYPPSSEAWGIVLNPSSGLMANLLGPCGGAASFFPWDVFPTASVDSHTRSGCFSDEGSCEGVPITVLVSRLSGGSYGVDYNGDGLRDATLTAEYELVSEVRRNLGGTYSYRWSLTNVGTGAAKSFLGLNAPGFDISPRNPLLGLAGADRIVGTSDDLASPARLLAGADFEIRPPGSQAWGIVMNPDLVIGTLLAPTADVLPPATSVSLSPLPNAAGWNSSSVIVSLSAVDNEAGTGVERLSVTLTGAQAETGAYDGDTATINVSAEGTTTISYFAIDHAGNAEEPKTITVRVDKTLPMVSGMPSPGCALWPPNGQFVRVATVTAIDPVSGISAFGALATSDETPVADGDVMIVESGVNARDILLRARRLGSGAGRTYTVEATAVDAAGNATTAIATCRVAHDARE